MWYSAEQEPKAAQFCASVAASGVRAKFARNRRSMLNFRFFSCVMASPLSLTFSEMSGAVLGLTVRTAFAHNHAGGASKHTPVHSVVGKGKEGRTASSAELIVRAMVRREIFGRSPTWTMIWSYS